MSQPIHLNPGQQADAVQIYRTAVARGVSPQRARELVTAAFHEGGLNPHAVNKSSGAAGDFQLLSSGYRQRAQQLGGLYDTQANERAILPDYQRYWQTHPNAAPGEAAAAVEKSGEGPGYYAAGLGELGAAVGGGKAPAAAPDAPGGGAPPPRTPSVGDPGARARLAMTLIAAVKDHDHHDLGGLRQAISDFHASQPQQPEPQPAAVAEPHPGAIVKGGYAFPVAGPIQGIDKDWLAPRTGHLHQGIDIPAAEGTPLVAIADGKVTAAGPSGAAGNRVWINGQWFYAHLSRIAVKPGEQVHRGQVIGYVGSTGDATGPHLHFGWSPDGSSGASWANPYSLLVRLHG